LEHEFKLCVLTDGQDVEEDLLLRTETDRLSVALNITLKAHIRQVDVSICHLNHANHVV
jgi:hypothetical protein